jgi:hypothetical protein
MNKAFLPPPKEARSIDVLTKKPIVLLIKTAFHGRT